MDSTGKGKQNFQHETCLVFVTFINNEKKWSRGKFAWQEGYGAFSYWHS
jgi:hypothetical protein